MPLILIHEGRRSEVAYLQALRVFARDELGIDPLPFIPKMSGKGSKGKKYRESTDDDGRGSGKYEDVKIRRDIEQERNKKATFEVWVDDDIYVRDDFKCATLYKSRREKDRLPIFRFNYHNFEDFIVLHRAKNEAQMWSEYCRKINHIEIPLKEEEYLPHYLQFFPTYKKKEFPFSKTGLTKEHMLNLFENNKSEDILLKSDFANFLENILGEYIRNMKDL